jgi:hypothetical protein
MLQIDHIYEFLYKNIFQHSEFWHLPNGVVKIKKDINIQDVIVFTPGYDTKIKIFFYDQEPFVTKIANNYMDVYTWPNNYSIDDVISKHVNNTLPYGLQPLPQSDLEFLKDNPQYVHKKGILVTSEISSVIDESVAMYNLNKMYYFFHGFAASDWYRGHYALNYNKSIVKQYKHDFISFNRIINNDRSYRIYFVSLLKELGLLEHGQVSFNVTDNLFDDWQDETSNPNSKLSVQAKQHAEHHLVNVNKLVIDRV